MVELAWWEYIIIAISAFFALLFLNYLAKSFNDARIKKRLATLEEKSLRNHATQIRTPINTVRIAKPFSTDTEAMGQLFSTVNRSRANSVINAPRTQSSQARSPPTPQPKSDTTIIIPLNGKQLQETALEKQQSTESNQEPIMNHLGKIYNDELTAFDVSDSNEDLEETSNISDSLDQVQEKSEEPVTLEQRGSEQVGKMPVKPVSLDHRGATLNQLEYGPQITSNVENMDKNSLPPNPRETTLEDTSNVHDGVKSKTDLVTDIPDHYPFVGSKSVFDAVIDLATDGLPRKSTVAIINNICAPHDKVSKHTILSKNSELGRMASDAPEPGDDDDETARELVEGIIVDTIQSGNYIPENQF